MKIPRQGIEEYRRLIKKKYSIDISYAEAEEGFRDLLSLFQVIYRPIDSFNRDTEIWLEANDSTISQRSNDIIHVSRPRTIQCNGT